jgi:hypothetical protein
MFQVCYDIIALTVVGVMFDPKKHFSLSIVNFFYSAKVYVCFKDVIKQVGLKKSVSRGHI